MRSCFSPVNTCADKCPLARQQTQTHLKQEIAEAIIGAKRMGVSSAFTFHSIATSLPAWHHFELAFALAVLYRNCKEAVALCKLALMDYIMVDSHERPIQKC